MNKKTILVITGVLLVLVGLVVVKSFRSRRPQSLIDEYRLTVIVPEDFMVSQVSGFKLFRGGQEEEKVEIARAQKKWRVLSRFSAPGDKKKIEAFLKKIKSIKGELRAGEEEALVDYRLDKDTGLHLVLEQGKKSPVHLIIGKTLGWKDQFIRRDGESAVYLIHTNLARDMEVYGKDEPKSTVWLDKAILKIDEEEIVEVALRWPDKELRFAKEEVEKDTAENEAGREEKPERRWIVKEPPADMEFKEDGFTDLLKSLAALNAADVADPQEYAELELTKPAYSCRLKLANGKERGFSAVRKETAGHAYLVVDGNKDIIYEVNSYNFSDIFPPDGEIFNLSLTDISAADVKKVTVAEKGKKLILTRSVEAWGAEKDGKEIEIDREKIESFIKAVTDLEGKSFTVDRKPPASEEAELSILLEDEKDKETRLLFGGSIDEMRIVGIDNKTFSYLIPAEDFAGLLKELTGL